MAAGYPIDWRYEAIRAPALVEEETNTDGAIDGDEVDAGVEEEELCGDVDEIGEIVDTGVEMLLLEGVEADVAIGLFDEEAAADRLGVLAIDFEAEDATVTVGEPAIDFDGETAAVLDGEAAIDFDGEAAIDFDGEPATVPEGEAATVLDGEAATVPDGEAATVPEGETATVPAGVPLGEVDAGAAELVAEATEVLAEEEAEDPSRLAPVTVKIGALE